MVVVLWLSLVFWTLKDGRKRIEDKLIIAVAVLTSLVFPFIGTLVYTILRPSEYLSDVRERELEMRAMEQELHVGAGVSQLPGTGARRLRRLPEVPQDPALALRLVRPTVGVLVEDLPVLRVRGGAQAGAHGGRRRAGRGGQPEA